CVGMKFCELLRRDGVPRSSHDPDRLSQSVLRIGGHSVPFRGSAIVPTQSYSFSPEPPKRCLHPYVRRYRTKSVDYFGTLRRAQTTRQPDSPECVEGEFLELRHIRVL